MDSNAVSLIFTLLGGCIAIAIVAIVGGFLHYRRERLLTHQERMKALELGREMPDDAATARIEAAFGTFSKDDKQEERGQLAEVLLHGALGGVLGICSSQPGRLGEPFDRDRGRDRRIRGSHRRHRDDLRDDSRRGRFPEEPAATPVRKQHFDADAFDVVSRRG